MSGQVNFSSIMRAQGYEVGPRCYATTGGSFIASMALFIIGCVGAAGAFPGSAIGWTTVGLAGGGFALSIAAGNFKLRKFDLIISGLMTAALVTIGAFGGAGILSATQVGWGIIGTSLAAMPLGCIVNCHKIKQTQF
jgi:hypothetical protein